MTGQAVFLIGLAVVVFAAVFFPLIWWLGRQTPVARDSPLEWCMATTALLTTVNGVRHDTFEGQTRPVCKRLLGMWWDVHDRASLLETVEWLRTEGHRAGRPELLAWDLCRAISVLRWGVGAKYLTREEAEPMILEIGQELQRGHRSWRQLAEGYMGGRTEWAARQGRPRAEPMLDHAMKRLLNERNARSPWRGIPWDRQL